MPFIKARNAHGNFFPAEDHTAFHIHFTAHVEGAGLGILGPDGLNDGSFHTGTDEHFGAILGIPKFQELTDGIKTCQTVALGTAGEHRVDAQFPASR